MLGSEWAAGLQSKQPLNEGGEKRVEVLPQRSLWWSSGSIQTCAKYIAGTSLHGPMQMRRQLGFGFNHFTTPFSPLPGDVVTELGTCTCLGIQGLCSAIEPQSFPELWLCPIPTYKYNDS